MLNPLVGYSFSFAEGAHAQNVNALEFGFGVVRIFPSKFWLGYTPTPWYNLETNHWNFDGHFTIGKMFSNGIGIGLEYGEVADESRVLALFDKSVLFNFYYQF